MIFVAMVCYLIYFQVMQSEEFINSPYNTRQDSFADRVVRGRILSSDGQVLAESLDDWEGGTYRNYPYGNIFAHVVGYDSNGKSGLEAEANFLLLRSHEYFLDQIRNEASGVKNKGDDVVTSLDTSLQTTAYYALGENRGAILAMEPKTGRILAMVSKPDFDPNDIVYGWQYMVEDENDSRLLNRVTDGAYPPGSIFKMVTALDYYRRKGNFDGFTFWCNGEVSMDDYTIHCYGHSAHGEEDFTRAFANSCNCAFAQIGVQLGAQSLRETAESLLFNKDLPFSSYRKSTFSLTKASRISLVMQTAIGQGDTLVSPLHMAMITCAVANNGVLMRPSLIDRVVTSDGQTVKTYEPSQNTILMSRSEAKILQRLMEEVVTSGTALSLNWNGYTAAGKTGSAEYNEEGDSHSWFVGYCNTDDPDLVVAVIVEGGGAGSESAVPIAGQIFDAYYYG